MMHLRHPGEQVAMRLRRRCRDLPSEGGSSTAAEENFKARQQST